MHAAPAQNVQAARAWLLPEFKQLARPFPLLAWGSGGSRD